MALPSLEKTWQFDVNQVTPTVGVLETDLDTMILKLKSSLIGFASTPWTVVRSSNGVTVAASDLWSTIADLVHGNSTRSWIVLKQTGCGGQGNLQICIDLNSSASSSYDLYLSWHAGFGAGTTSARPTATDETGFVLTWGSSTPGQNVLHVAQSSDGASTRVFLARDGVIVTTWLIDTQADCLASPNSGIFYATTGPLGVSMSTNTNLKGRHASTPYTAYCTGETAANVLVPQLFAGVKNQFLDAYHICPIGVFSGTPSVYGRVGRLVDIWWGSQAIASGSTYPLAGGQLFVQFGAVIFPWNGTVPVIN